MSEKKQVLVVCRTAAGQMYLAVLLNRIWYAPVLAKSAEEALRLSRNSLFSLVVMDGDLPQSELRSSLLLLRSDSILREAPLVVFLTSENAAISEGLLAEGCSAVLSKPLDLALLYGVLGRLSGQPRQAPRVPVKMRVEIGEGAPEALLTCINLSESGLYLRTYAPLQEGAVLHLRFTLPRDIEPVELTAEVMRTSPLAIQVAGEPGMGLRFLDVPEQIAVKIRNFVQWEMMGDLEWEADI